MHFGLCSVAASFLTVLVQTNSKNALDNLHILHKTYLCKQGLRNIAIPFYALKGLEMTDIL